MKKLALVLTTTLAFGCLVFFAVFPVQDSQGFNYTVREYTVKSGYETLNCPATGFPVEPLVYMDVSEISGPCDCPSYYDYNGTISAPFSGRFCP